MRLTTLIPLLLLASACAAPSFNGVVLDPPEAAPALSLADSSGVPFSLAAQRGKVVLVFFGYTHCPDVCPTTLLDWKRSADSLGSDARDVRFVFVSVDPERDTPALVQRYTGRIAPDFIGLTGSRTQVDALMQAWNVAAFRDDAGRDTSTAYTVSHPSQVFVIDGDGQLRLLHRAGITPSQITSDIRALL